MDLRGSPRHIPNGFGVVVLPGFAPCGMVSRADQIEKASKPPSITVIVPETNFDASLASHCSVPSSSEGSPKRP